jgi:hypothetical protein
MRVDALLNYMKTTCSFIPAHPHPAPFTHPLSPSQVRVPSSHAPLQAVLDVMRHHLEMALALRDAQLVAIARNRSARQRTRQQRLAQKSAASADEKSASAEKSASSSALVDAAAATWRCAQCACVNAPPSGPLVTAVLEATAAAAGLPVLAPAAAALIVNAIDAPCQQCQQPRSLAGKLESSTTTATAKSVASSGSGNDSTGSHHETKQPEASSTTTKRRRRHRARPATHWACGSCLYANEYTTALVAATATSNAPSKDDSSAGGSAGKNEADGISVIQVAQSPLPPPPQPPLSCAVCGAIKRAESKASGYGVSDTFVRS